MFGHVPLLSDPVFADYMQAYGEGRAAGRASRRDSKRLARLYWHTVEFGLIRSEAGLRIYGAGIVSSHGESRYALESPKLPRIAFDLHRVMRTRYNIDDYQPAYFVIERFLKTCCGRRWRPTSRRSIMHSRHPQILSLAR